MSVRAIASVLAGVLVAIAAIGVYLATRIEPRAYVQLVADRVHAATGRSLRIDGPIGYSLSFVPTITAENVVFQNAPWGSRPDMLRAKRIGLRIALLPLFSGNVDIRALELVEPDVLVEVDAKGRGNWQLEAGRADPPTAPQALPLLRSARVSGGVLAYRDARKQHEHRVDIETLSLTTSDAAANLDAKVAINGLALALAGKLVRDPNASSDAVANVDMAIAGEGLRLAFRGPMPINAAASDGLDLAFTAEVSDWTGAAKLARIDPPRLPALQAQGRLRRQADTLAIEPLEARLGRSSVGGSLMIGLAGETPNIDAKLHARALDLAELLGPGKPSPKRDARMFSSEPFAVAPLAFIDGTANIRIDRIAMRDGKALDGLDMLARLKGGKLLADPLRVRIEGKELRARIGADASSGNALVLSAVVEGKGIALGALGALFNISGTPEGSPTDIDVRISGRGNSMRALMAGANGEVRLVIGPGRLRNRVIDFGADISELLDAINPGRAAEPYTDLKCAVIRLPINQGIIRIDNSVAAETARVNLVVAGVIDLRNETLDLGFRPQAATGLGIGIGGLANLARVRGTLTKPRVELDFSGAAKAAAGAALAAAKGDLSSVAGGLLFDSVPDRPCQSALSGRTRTPPEPRAAPVIDEVLGNVKKLFGR
ncbi:MAG: AsmA family protein [Burkholderiales bacterium]|nr:AsmA family protein [Burkholderiales bacterium]